METAIASERLASEDEHVGARVREIRRTHRLSARELASRAGVSAAYLSRLENGRLSPTVSTLTRIMRAMGEPVSNAFGDRDLTGPVVRVHDRRVIRERGVNDYLLLADPLRPARGARDRDPARRRQWGPYTNPGLEECVVVLEGAFRMWVERIKVRPQLPGDAITSRAGSLIVGRTPGRTRRAVLWVLTPAAGW